MDVIPQLDTSTYLSQLFWFIISFTSLYFVVSKLVIPKIEDLIRKRYAITQNSLNNSYNFCKILHDHINQQLFTLQSVNSVADHSINEALQESQYMMHNLKLTIHDELSKMFKLVDEQLQDTILSSRKELIQLSFEIALIYYNKLFNCNPDMQKLHNITLQLYKEKL
ncbi:ATP synthase subunit B family protein [Candidatus Neoehrlichia procyonis]|uniref:ATP synthase B/B' CF family protein n=1 Tax=Candidatus Neoehrlichia procyonis str. RAC413 TaxID=1359163 RepID=A0A0F3NP18_9RICK|nr:hypothetical protein [Candidatus Neoehrlichia lotoris]KJV69447.1 ATP synthase B/B' CF family protein [Candidatus Neoehrlichia lotoris str. RAC413]